MYSQGTVLLKSQIYVHKKWFSSVKMKKTVALVHFDRVAALKLFSFITLLTDN